MPIAAHALNISYKTQFMNNKDDYENDSSITAAEKAMLDEVLQNDPLSKDEINLKRAELDDVDDDGDFLNEETSAVDNTGEDLDIPGSEDDDADEAIGEEDEENNGYSQADTA
jgi:hypothetical protein